MKSAATKGARIAQGVFAVVAALGLCEQFFAVAIGFAGSPYDSDRFLLSVIAHATVAFVWSWTDLFDRPLLSFGKFGLSALRTLCVGLLVAAAAMFLVLSMDRTSEVVHVFLAFLLGSGFSLFLMLGLFGANAAPWMRYFKV